MVRILRRGQSCCHRSAKVFLHLGILATVITDPRFDQVSKRSGGLTVWNTITDLALRQCPAKHLYTVVRYVRSIHVHRVKTLKYTELP